MEKEHNKVKDLGRIFKHYVSHGFQKQKQQQQQGSQRAENQGQRRSYSFEEQMLTFMVENKRLLKFMTRNVLI